MTSQTTTPSQAEVKLINPNGKVVSNTPMANGTGNFKYTKLKSPNYSVSYSTSSPGNTLAYTIKDAQKQEKIKDVVLVHKTPNTTATNSAPQNTKVNGKVQIPEGTQKPEDLKISLVDREGKIIQTTTPAEDGSFTFDKLATGSYKAIYETKDQAFDNPIKYNVTDNSLKRITLPSLYARAEKSDTLHLTKQLTLPTLTSKPTQVIYEKVDTVKNNNVAIVNKANPDSLAVNKNTVTTRLTPTDTAGKVAITDTFTNSNNALVKTTRVKKEVILPTPFEKFKPGVTYDDLGFEVQPEGYGVQVSSFVINSNLKAFCQRLKAKGEKNIYVQVIQRDPANPQNLAYRVIIGEIKDKEKATKLVPVYMDKGYDAVLRKHLSIPVQSPENK